MCHTYSPPYANSVGKRNVGYHGGYGRFFRLLDQLWGNHFAGTAPGSEAVDDDELVGVVFQGAVEFILTVGKKSVIAMSSVECQDWKYLLT